MCTSKSNMQIVIVSRSGNTFRKWKNETILSWLICELNESQENAHLIEECIYEMAHKALKYTWIQSEFSFSQLYYFKPEHITYTHAKHFSTIITTINHEALAKNYAIEVKLSPMFLLKQGKFPKWYKGAIKIGYKFQYLKWRFVN
jgi:hypothetical protein